MIKISRSRRLLIGCTTVGVAAVVGMSGAVAAAEPMPPAPPTPGHAPAYPPGPSAVPEAAPAPLATPAPAGAVPTLPAPAALVPASSATLRDYFADNGVRMEPQQAANFTALNITLPMPPGWTQVPDPNVPDAFAVIADRRTGALYTPNAQLVVYRLVGDFKPEAAITHGYVDSQKLPAWRTTNASLADFDGFPSSAIEGTYRQNDMTLNTSQRYVIASSGSDSYLVSLAVITGAGQSVGNAPATDAIVNGFRVASPGGAPAAAAAPTVSPVPGAPDCQPFCRR